MIVVKVDSLKIDDEGQRRRDTAIYDGSEPLREKPLHSLLKHIVRVFFIKGNHKCYKQ